MDFSARAFTGGGAAADVFGHVLRGVGKLRAGINLDALRDQQELRDLEVAAGGPLNLPSGSAVSAAARRASGSAPPPASVPVGAGARAAAPTVAGGSGGSWDGAGRRGGDALSDAERTLLQDMRDAGLAVDEAAVRGSVSSRRGSDAVAPGGGGGGGGGAGAVRGARDGTAAADGGNGTVRSGATAPSSSWAPGADAAVRQLPSLLGTAAMRAAGSVADAASSAAQSAASALGAGATSAAALVPRFGAAAPWASASTLQPPSPVPGSLKRLSAVLGGGGGGSGGTAAGDRRVLSGLEEGAASLPVAGAAGGSILGWAPRWAGGAPPVPAGGGSGSGGRSDAARAAAAGAGGTSAAADALRRVAACPRRACDAAAAWLACALVPALLLTRALACALPCALRAGGCQGVAAAFSRHVAARLSEKQLAALVGVVTLLLLAWLYGWLPPLSAWGGGGGELLTMRPVAPLEGAPSAVRAAAATPSAAGAGSQPPP